MENKVFEVENDMIVKYYGNGGDIVLPSGVKDIFFEVFSMRKDITSVVIPGSIEEITPFVFERCSLKKLVINEGVKSISLGSFLDCISLETVYLPKTIKEISRRAFEGCTSLKIIYYAGSKEEWDLVNKTNLDCEIIFDYKY